MIGQLLAAVLAWLALLAAPLAAHAGTYVSYAQGDNATGYWVEYSDGTAAELPPRRAALRECRDDDRPRQCRREARRTYRELSQLTSAKG